MQSRRIYEGFRPKANFSQPRQPLQIQIQLGDTRQLVECICLQHGNYSVWHLSSADVGHGCDSWNGWNCRFEWKLRPHRMHNYPGIIYRQTKLRKELQEITLNGWQVFHMAIISETGAGTSYCDVWFLSTLVILSPLKYINLKLTHAT